LSGGVEQAQQVPGEQLRGLGVVCAGVGGEFFIDQVGTGLAGGVVDVSEHPLGDVAAGGDRDVDVLTGHFTGGERRPQLR
jgi:hypothetical protein